MATRLTKEQKLARIEEERVALLKQIEEERASQHQTLAQELTTIEETLEDLDTKEQAELAAVAARFTARKDKLNVRALEIQEILANEIGHVSAAG